MWRSLLLLLRVGKLPKCLLFVLSSCCSSSVLEQSEYVVDWCARTDVVNVCDGFCEPFCHDACSHLCSFVA